MSAERLETHVESADGRLLILHVTKEELIVEVYDADENRTILCLTFDELADMVQS